MTQVEQTYAKQIEVAHERIALMLQANPNGVPLGDVLAAVSCNCGAPSIEAISRAISSSLSNDELELTTDRILRTTT